MASEIETQLLDIFNRVSGVLTGYTGVKGHPLLSGYQPPVFGVRFLEYGPPEEDIERVGGLYSLDETTFIIEIYAVDELALLLVIEALKTLRRTWRNSEVRMSKVDRMDPSPDVVETAYAVEFTTSFESET